MLSLSFRILLLSISLLTCVPVFSQGIKGRLTDNQSNPVPFAAIYDETTYAGTTSNAEGYYELKLEPGQHSIVIKAMGYYLVRRSVTTASQLISLNIQLNEQAVELKEVVITPGKEDPAYAIMRRVIGRAPYHLNQVKEYNADVYLRGTIHIINIPKFIARHTEINGKKNAIKNGDVYLEESINHIHFNAPDKYEQKVISYQSTMPGSGNNDVNPMQIINSSLYEAEIEDIISPLAPNAFSFYTFRYEGFFDEGEHVIFKIKVTPKRNSQQLMRGYIYIVDKLWCLHSTDVSVQMFFGTLSYKNIYSPIKSSAWLPISYQFHVDAAIMGIKANYKYASSVKFQEVVLNEKSKISPVKTDEPLLSQDSPVQSKTDAKKAKNQQYIENLLSKEELSNRDMVKLATLMAKEAPNDTAKTKSLEIKENDNKVTVEKDAMKKDTAYWNSNRPIPLTSIETLIPALIDSTLAESKDTLSSNEIAIGSNGNGKWSKIAGFITTGKSFSLFDNTLQLKYDGIIGLKKIDFNTVDGFIYRQTFGLEQRIDSTHRLKVNPGIAYAFSRERIMWWTDLNYDYLPMRGGNIHFHIGSESADYNSETGLNSTINSLASLFFRRNYLKLYQQNQAFITNKIEVANGLNLSATVGYRTARVLDNHSGFSFFYRDEREYSPNIPDNNPEIMSVNLFNEEAYWDVQIEFTPYYYYRVWGGRKQYQHSKYPTLFLRNKMAIPGIANSTADYDLFEIGLKQRKEWGMMHAFSWNVKGGLYLNRNRVFAMDYKYFNNQNLPLALGNINDAFRLLPFYRYATSHDFVEAHIKFTTPYLLLKYLPFLSNKIWCENLHFNYLTTGPLHDYWEVGYSLSQIYMVGSIGVYAGFKGDRYQSYGVQVSIDFD